MYTQHLKKTNLDGAPVFRLAGGVWAFYIRAKASSFLLDFSFLFYLTAVQWIAAECPKPMRRIDCNRCSDPSKVSSMAPEVLCLYCVEAKHRNF